MRETVVATGQTVAASVRPVALTVFAAGFPPVPGRNGEKYKSLPLPLSRIFRTFA